MEQITGWTKEESQKVAKWMKSKEGKKKLSEVMDKDTLPHVHSYPSNQPCCIKWWNSIKDIPYTI
jgi:hypothetical protein